MGIQYYLDIHTAQTFLIYAIKDLILSIPVSYIEKGDIVICMPTPHCLTNWKHFPQFYLKFDLFSV